MLRIGFVLLRAGIINSESFVLEPISMLASRMETFWLACDDDSDTSSISIVGRTVGYSQRSLFNAYERKSILSNGFSLLLDLACSFMF